MDGGGLPQHLRREHGGVDDWRGGGICSEATFEQTGTLP